MLFSKVLCMATALAASEALTLRGLDGDVIPSRSEFRPSRVKRQNANQCLNANAVQTGSESDGQQPPVAGQTASATDNANFINFCSGKTLTNGLQVLTGSCNGIVMGEIPSKDNMISAIIINPKPGDNLAAETTFTLSVQISGLQAGAFTNAQKTYYAAPQKLNGQGVIIGHTHFTVQDLGNNLAPNQPPDPKNFVFFKGIDGAGNGNGLLSVDVTGGLPAGNYRVCTMTSTSNHQPVLMPVAQRGAQDDCQKFTVGGAGGGAAGGGNNNGGNNNNNNNNNNGGQQNGGQQNNNGGQQNGGQNNNAGANNAGANNAGAAAGNNTGNAGGAAGNAGGSNAGKAGGNAGNAGGNKAGNAGGNAGGAKAGANAGGNAAAAAGALGGVAAPPVTDTGDKTRPFSVNGNTFVNKSAAIQRSCDIQRNGCFDAFNRGTAKGFGAADCEAQATKCNAQT